MQQGQDRVLRTPAIIADGKRKTASKSIRKAY